VRTIRRGGPYLRVADPGWQDPLDGRFAQRRGGRWNPLESFPVVYLCESVGVARAVVLRKLEGQPYGPEDLNPETAPVLVGTSVPEDRYVDVVTRRGRASAGLPESYPRDRRGAPIGWARCQPIGRAAWERDAPGIACLSAAPEAPPQGEELAWFQRRRRRLRRRRVHPFDEWFWPGGAGSLG
jgi:RES domain-containing protein